MAKNSTVAVCLLIAVICTIPAVSSSILLLENNVSTANTVNAANTVFYATTITNANTVYNISEFAYDFVIYTQTVGATQYYYAANETGVAFSGTNASTVIQAAIDAGDSLFFKSGLYEIDSQITSEDSEYICSFSNATIHSSYSGSIFKFGSLTSFNKMNSVCGFYGITLNSDDGSTSLFNITNCAFFIKVANVKTDIASLGYIYGACYGYTISDVMATNAVSDYLTVGGYNDGVDYAPNNGEIRHMEVNGDSYASSTGIIITDGVGAARGTKIVDCWLEGFTTCIVLGGTDAIVDNVHFYAVDTCINITENADRHFITNCRLASDDDGALVEVNSEQDNYIFDSNIFYSIKDYGIKINSERCYFTITGNRFSFDTSYNGTAIYGGFRATTIDDNYFYSSSKKGIGIKMESIYSLSGVVIQDNHFYDLYSAMKSSNTGSYFNINGNIISGNYVGLSFTNIDNSIVSENSFSANTIDVVESIYSTCRINENHGYITENAGTATTSGGSYTVNHGLEYTPSISHINIILQGNATYYVDTITSTQFTVHTSAGAVAFGWAIRRV